MNGFLKNFCRNIAIANYTSSFNVYESEMYMVEAIVQCYERNNSPSIIFVPICENSHWTLLIIDVEKRKYFHFNSLKNKTDAGNLKIQRTIEIFSAKKGMKFDFLNLTHPSQYSTWECGYFVLLASYKYAMGQPMQLSRTIVNNFRKYLLEILDKKFEYLFVYKGSTLSEFLQGNLGCNFSLAFHV